MKMPFSNSNKSILNSLFFVVFNLIFLNLSYGAAVRDTVNLVDEENLKQGYWIEYCNATKIREGNYIDNKKIGIWKNYRKTGVLSYTIRFTNGVPNGEMCSYYSDGKLLEKGTWVIDHWEGEYYTYFENGKLSGHFFFNKYGKRTGYQKYYHENGELKISGSWKNGNKEGTINEYYKDGSVKCKKVFCKGMSNPELQEEFPKGIKLAEKKNGNSESSMFSGNGYHVFYNKNQQTDREGDFKNGKLINGKRYYYSLKGILQKTAIYQNSKVIRWITH